MDVIVVPLTRIPETVKIIFLWSQSKSMCSPEDRVSQIEGSKVVLGLWALPCHIWVVLLGLLVEGRLHLHHNQVINLFEGIMTNL